MRFTSLLFVSGLASFAAAKDVIVMVGASNNTVYQPNNVTAEVGDVVRFKFVGGNHSVTQGSFDQPCIFISKTNTTINGFDSGLRPGGNATADFTVPIGGANVNTTMWVYDTFPGSCADGNVMVINANESSPENLAAAIRNAERLNGTMTSTATPSATKPSSADGASSSSSTTTTTQGSWAMRPLIPVIASSVLALSAAAALFF